MVCTPPHPCPTQPCVTSGEPDGVLTVGEYFQLLQPVVCLPGIVPPRRLEVLALYSVRADECIYTGLHHRPQFASIVLRRACRLHTLCNRPSMAILHGMR